MHKDLDQEIAQYDEIVLNYNRSQLSLYDLLREIDYNDKSLKEKECLRRHQLRQQEPWFMKIANKFLRSA